MTELHQWTSFEINDATYLFDITFLASNWTCIYGNGCQGVLAEPSPALMQGCCSNGAHFSDKLDRKRVERFAARLTGEQWQFKDEAEALGGPIHKNDDGDIVSHLTDGACIFLNRPGFANGAGCSLHQAATEAGERPLDWKPDVCWQLPLRLDHHVDDNGHCTYTLREWKRRDWGEGGDEFHWWCTESADAFVAPNPVYETLRDEIVEMVGEAAYDPLHAFMKEQQSQPVLAHPAVRRLIPLSPA